MTDVPHDYDMVNDVCQWMQEAGQGTPSSLTVNFDTLTLRKKLVKEEAEELNVALLCASVELASNIVKEGEVTLSPERVADVLKEAADLLVVTFGLFLSLGVRVEPVFKMVMDNNWSKLQEFSHDENGKIVVDPERKQQLKADMERELLEYVQEQMK